MVKKTNSKTKKLAGRSSHPGSSRAWLAKQLKSIKAFRDTHVPLKIIDYWELGRRSAKLVADAEVRGVPAKPEDIAARLGHKTDATIRQTIKFAKGVSKKRAQALQEAGLPWRGVIYWLGVESKADSRDLYQQMLKGLTNSSNIRLYIAKRFNKQASPRKRSDRAAMAKKAVTRAKVMTAALAAFVEVCERFEDQASASDRREFKKLGKALTATSDQIRSTRACIKRLNKA